MAEKEKEKEIQNETKKTEKTITQTDSNKCCSCKKGGGKCSCKNNKT